MTKVSVLIVSEGIDHKGIIANASFVVGLTAGKLIAPETFSGDVVDGDGSKHTYLTNIAHMVRRAGQNKMRTLRKDFMDAGCVVVDYTDAAAPSDYATYEKTIAELKGEQITYRAFWVYGDEEIVVPKTKNLSSLQ